MRRPKTYKFSELFSEGETVRVSMECREYRHVLRRRGRPIGKTGRARFARKLKQITKLLQQYTPEQVALQLKIPLEVLTDWINDTRNDNR